MFRPAIKIIFINASRIYGDRLTKLLKIFPKFSSGFATEYTTTNTDFIAINLKTQQIILIENDALVYKINEKVRIPLKHSEYPANLNEYVPFSVKKKNYFVHEGCGVVLEYRNDSIVRIDNSFLHKNQFDAASFVYKNEIYFFGGYGLFTHKNILTKYDFKMREWVLVDFYTNLNSPALSNPFYFSIKENIYLSIATPIKSPRNESIIG